MRAFTACPSCGSLDLRSPKASEGGLGVAFFERSKCRECGWTGTPIEFEAEADWRAFCQAKGMEAAAVQACPQCGSRDLRLEGTGAHCPHCLWRGVPRTFATEAEWLAFAESRKNWKGKGGEAA